MTISGLDVYNIVETILGTVNLQTMEIMDHLTKKVNKVRRTLNNLRKRPNAHRRHDPIEDEFARGSSFFFNSKEDLEYLSLNYRKERAANICTSKRRLVIIMF